jgi:hypothetical protein
VSSDQKQDDGHPVLTGLGALVGVAVVVGLLVSGAALAASSVLGIGDEEASTSSTSSASMYLPKPSDTAPASGPAFTLAPGETTAPAETPTAPPSPEFPITLSAAQASVSPMQEIQLAGTYPTGEGKVVQVQRFENEQWVDFSTVDAVVNGGAFSTYVLTARSGENRFRVRDTDSDEVSNEVAVQVG